MGLINRWKSRKAEDTRQQNVLCEELRSQIRNAMDELMTWFRDRHHEIDPGAGKAWTEAHRALLTEKYAQEVLHLCHADSYRQLADEYYDLTQCARILEEEIVRHNDALARIRAGEANRIIGPVEGHELDRQQLDCIVREARNHLVIAGAGTGKTTTIVGRVKYLLASGQCRPEELLVLSFTNASASEMSERLRAATGVRIQASTFHSLGLSVLRQVDGAQPLLTTLNLKSFVREQLQLQMENADYLAVLTTYLLYYRNPSPSAFSFRSQREYDESRLQNPPKTVKNQTVRHYGEMDIANFLTANGIAYRYDYAYAFDPQTPEYGPYRSSFYLQEHRIYLEYWWVDRSDRPPFLSAGLNARNELKASQAEIRWKQNLHRANHTTLIDCYAYEKAEGTLLSGLKRKLEAHGVVCRPVSPEKLWKTLSKDHPGILDGMANLMETVLTLMKSNEETVESLRLRNRGGASESVNEMLLQLLGPISRAYNARLEQAGEIDFNDMINRASRYLREGRWTHRYRHVIVDEYQDISRARFRLLHQMRQTKDFHLFCVGDDWQSIYRFAGSDIDFILNFEQYWGPAQISRIETTYRFPQRLVDISSTFIMENPAQKRKAIVGMAENSGFALGEICSGSEDASLERMLERLKKLPRNSSVFLIGRYSFDLKALQDHPALQRIPNPTTGFTDLLFAPRRDLKLTFLTAHRSKGLQADYVVILNNRRARMGFPSKVQDAPLMGLLLHSWERYPDAEERRLFYVALTRARKKVFLLTVRGQESDFVLELRRRHGPELRQEAQTES